MDLAPFKTLSSTSQIIRWAGLGEPGNIFMPSDSRVSVGYLMGRVRSPIFLLLLLLLMDFSLVSAALGSITWGG